MATQVQFRGGTTTEHASFNGVAKEVTVDTTKQTLVVQDGSTNGGFPLLGEKNADNVKLHFGGNGTTDDGDFQLFHNGTRAKIQNNTGELRICSNVLELKNYADDANYLSFATNQNATFGGGVRHQFRHDPNPNNRNTGNITTGTWYKIGELTGTGGDAFRITIFGTTDFSSTNSVAAENILAGRVCTSNTIQGYWYTTTQGLDGIQAASWKYTGANDKYELWVKFGPYQNYAPFVDCSAGDFTVSGVSTSSTTQPTGSTLFATTFRLTADTGVQLGYSNVTKLETTATGVKIDGSLKPSTSNSYDLGASGDRWHTLHTKNIIALNNIQVNGDPTNGVNQGLELSESGYIETCNTNDNYYLWKGYKQGSGGGNGTLTSSIKVDGTADFGGNLSINGATSTGSKGRLDVRASGDTSSNLTAVFGADEGQAAGALSDDADKAARVGLYHYDRDEEAYALFSSGGTSSANSINFGGGTSLMNAATSIGFYTASNTTTTTGTKRLEVTDSKVMFAVDAKVDSDNQRDLGASGARWKDLYLSGGLYVGGTDAANKFEDYEEGVHTQASINANLTLTNNILRYTKIGRVVTVNGMLKPSAVSGTNQVKISLPFTSIADSGTTCGRYTSALMHKHVNIDDSYKNVVGYIGQSENYYRIYNVGDNLDWHQLTNNDISTDTEIFFTFTYLTTA